MLMRLEQPDRSMYSSNEGEGTTAYFRTSLPAKLNSFSRGNFSCRPHNSTLTYVLWLKSSDVKHGQSNAKESKFGHFCMPRLWRIVD